MIVVLLSPSTPPVQHFTVLSVSHQTLLLVVPSKVRDDALGQHLRTLSLLFSVCLCTRRICVCAPVF